ncbi:hypothetical protein N658DRAFT_508076 [Parathielavia hyrcaniae]|uniref:Mediator of RNA polymerase II transcription subunit 11 n=1 Tax=Parathielavia hyrcaniae TaxID=113614 RepID=A0AAN6T113_9PEZI|nr:hypothetical protein N658DRAFT_508076 [Parathielavia hyrcaniae]
MNDPSDEQAVNGANRTDATDAHTPFSPSERIQQLSEIDNDIAALLLHLSSAMRALATPPPDSADAPTIAEPDAAGAPDPVAAFKTAQSAFFQTIDRVDKHLTRQILALEEAGIITLRSTGAGAGVGAEGEAPGSSQPQHGGAGGGGGEASAVRAARGASAVPRLEPDGMGRFGSLDVGKLNMASSTVERDMERDLWRRAREELARLVEGSGDGGLGDRMEE